MQFGMFFQLPQAQGQSHTQLYYDLLDRIQYADTLGFDTAWIPEIHFSGAFSLLSNPLMLFPLLAERTNRLRFGTAITVLPLQSPLTYAEQAATADILTGGRLEFGIGRGSIPSQFHGFGIPMVENRERFDEALDVLRLAWTKERFSYHGQFYQAENLSVVPKPAQQPHPPLRVAVHSPESFTHIGDLGLPIYSGTTTSPIPQIRDGMALYRERMQHHGHLWHDHQFALMLPLYIGQTSTIARDAMRPGVEKFYRNLVETFSHLPTEFLDNATRLHNMKHHVDNLPYERFCAEHSVFGDAQECIDRIQALRDEFGLSQLICWFDQGNQLPTEAVKRAMAAFAHHVMPKL